MTGDRTVAEDGIEEDGIEHGTYGGYQQCRRRADGSCLECRAANNAYVRQWRQTNKPRQVALAADQAARDRALRRLARRHPAEFGALFEEELAQIPARLPVTGGAG